MRKFVVCLLVVSFISCAKKTPSQQGKVFGPYKDRFIAALWKHFPDQAGINGFHAYDSVLVVNDAATREQQLAFAKTQLDSLKQFDPKTLDAGDFTDWQMMENHLKNTLFNLNEFKAWQWDPSGYNVSEPFAQILNGSYAPLEERLRNASLKLRSVPAYFAAAKANIANPTLEHTELAIAQNTGGLSVFETDLPKILATSSLSQVEKDSMLARNSRAIVAIKDYADWLKKLNNPHPRCFRLGKELYEKKFAFDIQSAYNPEQIYAKAMAHKDELHTKMLALAKKLWPKYLQNAPMPADNNQLIRQVIDKISLQHTTPQQFQAAIERQIPDLLAFIKQKDLIYIDPSKPLEVRREPDYMAGVAGASISAPGPYDKNAKTFYNVGSLSGYSPADAESYLREYNDYILQILNIHEAVPGHYTQLVYSNQSPSLVKSVMGNGAMIEGWAVYSELMMLENGYHPSDEMWLMYYKWNLRSTCNTILDIAVHTKNMDREGALHLLMDEAFQQRAEAEGKWRRVSLTQVQLCSYFTGFTEICELREKYRQQQGKAFKLKQFHADFLQYGSAPVKYIAQLMLAKN